MERPSPRRRGDRHSARTGGVAGTRPAARSARPPARRGAGPDDLVLLGGVVTTGAVVAERRLTAPRDRCPACDPEIVLMNVTSLGSCTYDTQIRGNTTGPLFNIEKITRAKGSCTM